MILHKNHFPCTIKNLIRTLTNVDITMTYDPLLPKPSSFFHPSARRDGPSVTSMPVGVKLLWQSPNYFYGTDYNGEKDNFRSSITRGMKERLVAPILELGTNPMDYFVRPYDGCCSAYAMFLTGPLMAAIVLGSLPAVSLLPLAVICVPAVVELFFGITSVVQALWHTSMALLPRTREEELNKAHEYFLDAATRLSLVAPLALLCAVALPFETLRFFTRLAGTCLSKPASQPVQEDRVSVFFIPAITLSYNPRPLIGDLPFHGQGHRLNGRQTEGRDTTPPDPGYTLADLPASDKPTMR